MSIRRTRRSLRTSARTPSAVGTILRRRTDLAKLARKERAGKTLRLEGLEERQMMAAGPQLIGIQPNQGAVITEGVVLNVAPTDLTFRFNEGQVIDPSTLGAITLVRAGLDDDFATLNDNVTITPGFVGLGDVPNEVIMRFAQPLPDNKYRITIRGAGANPLENINNEPFNMGTSDLVRNFELNLGAQVIAVVPQPIDITQAGRSQRLNEIDVYFNQDRLDEASAEDPQYYQLIYTNTTVRNTDDIVHHPNEIIYTPATATSAAKATLRFTSVARIDQLSGPGAYRLRIGTAEETPLPPSTLNAGDAGSTFTSSLDIDGLLNAGPDIVISGGGAAIVDGSTVTITDNSNPRRTLTFEFDRDVPAALSDPMHIAVPYAVGDSAATLAASLATAINAQGPFTVIASVVGNRIDLTNDVNVQLDADLAGLASLQHVTSSSVISAAITAQNYPLVFPGGNDEPGHRDVIVESHLNSGPDGTSGISTIAYNFRDLYGVDPFGNPLLNLITAAQKQRAREIFEIYSEYLGIDFVETADQGLTIATGDLRAVSPTVPTGPGGVAGIAGLGLAVMDNAETWDDSYGGSWFEVAMHEIGHLLGLGHTYDLPPNTIMGQEGSLGYGQNQASVFPGAADIVHGQHRFRPESKDIDLYRFTVQATGLFSAETIAERQTNATLLNSALTLWKENEDGTRTLIAQNDDYFSEDSQIRLELTAGVYFVGVSSTGNGSYDPNLEDSGFYGTSQGAYQLRLDFRPNVTKSIVDTTGVALDGDADGVAGGAYNFWFRAAPPTLGGAKANPSEPRTIYVDKAAAPGGNGTLAAPFREIDNAFDRDAANPNNVNAADPGDIVRIIGNLGIDQDIDSPQDARPFVLGTPRQGVAEDGTTMRVPKDVTVMIDAGAVFKVRRASIDVGSTSPVTDRSGGALQVLGTPDLPVFFTSIEDESLGVDVTPDSVAPVPGNWGGLLFKSDIDDAALRFDWERQGIFLNYVNHADIRYGGGQINVDGFSQIVTPVAMVDSRPTVTFNTITRSAHAAMSASPNSFEETNFHTPEFQLAGSHTLDYDRVGPDIHGNNIGVNQTGQLFTNTFNGMSVGIPTPAGNLTHQMTVAGRFDDRDIVHIISENLTISGTPGGPLREQTGPSLNLVTFTKLAGGTLPAATYEYRVVFVDASGNEAIPSSPTRPVTLTQADIDAGVRSLRLNNLPQASAPFVARRIYRSIDGGATYIRVAEIPINGVQFVDNGTTLGGQLVFPTTGFRARTDARLAVDPSVVVKLDGARIETGIGAQIIAEGYDGREVIFTSLRDDRFGAGGTFDTTANGFQVSLGTGDWGGIYVGPMGTGNIDHALIAYGGGTTRIEGNFAAFNPLEIHQAEVRVAHTTFENNASGVGGAGGNRAGRGANAASVIFVLGAQPTILGNIIRDNTGPAISADLNSLNHYRVVDLGRATGPVDSLSEDFDENVARLALRTVYEDNQGPLIRENRLIGGRVAGRVQISGLQVRTGTLATQGVWDDADITHIVTNEINIPDFHTYGGLRLESQPGQSLVIKLQGANAGFSAEGRPLDINDRIGGMLHVVGQPGFPVVMTSLRDDRVGAGIDPFGSTVLDTNGDGPSTGSPGDWRGIQLNQFSHDRNVAIVTEQEKPNTEPPGVNATPNSAQVIGALAPHEKSGDETLRLGFEVHGFINQPGDVDVYAFTAEGGTEVWFDIDRTTHNLDTVIDLIENDGGNGFLLAQSDDSVAEGRGVLPLYVAPAQFPGEPPVLQPSQVNVLQKSAFGHELLSNGVGDASGANDHWTTNLRDAGMRVILPGTTGQTNTYYVRVRSSNFDVNDPSSSRDDLRDPSKLFEGNTTGAYQLNVRLRELDELPGSTVQFADLRYAVNAIEINGLPAHSPITGEAGESSANNDTLGSALALGNILNNDRATLGIAGALSSAGDVDFYQFTINYDSVQSIGGFSNPALHLSTVFDIDYADGAGNPNTRLAIFNSAGRVIYSSLDSNISDDRPAPLNGNDFDDLSRGTVGAFDPYVGTVELPIGTYYVAVMSNDRMPQELEQTMVRLPSNQLVRLEPINSLRRIVEDHLGAGTSNIPASPATGGGNSQFLNLNNVVPWGLHDVTLFVSQDSNVSNQTRLLTVDPFSGSVETNVGTFGRNVRDITMHPQGRLHSYSVFGDTGDNTRFSDAQTGNYLQIDTGTAALSQLSDDGIETWETDADGNVVLSNNVNGTRVGEGMHFEAMTIAVLPNNGIIGGNYLGFAVGGRDQLIDQRNFQNVLYVFDPATGAATSAPAPNRVDGGRVAGAATQIVERGILNTLVDANPQGVRNVIGAAEATFVGTNDATTFQIMDRQYTNPLPPEIPPATTFPHPTTFTVSGTTFEFDAGPEALFDIDPTVTNLQIRDGQQFLVNATPIEFDTGPVVVVNGAASTFRPGDLLRITDVDPDPSGPNSRAPQTLTFEFVANLGDQQPGNIPIRLVGQTQNQMVTDIVNAINAQALPFGFTTNAVRLPGTTRISLTNASLGTINPDDDSDASIQLIAGSTGLAIQGAVGVAAGAVRVRIEETSVLSELRDSFDRVNQRNVMPLNTQVGVSGAVGVGRVTVGFDGERINFSGATSISGSTLNGNVFSPVGSAGGVTVGFPTRVPVPFLAEDTADDIANRMVTALNGAGFFTAFAAMDQVIIPGSTVTATAAPLSSAAQAPGGVITGIAMIGNNLWAVSDRGGLFRVLNPTSAGFARLDYIDSPLNELNGIEFAGLAAGPRHVENGRYANMLFGIDEDGELYAFDTNGELQEIFVSASQGGGFVAQSSVQTGITNAHGLAFSNLDYNLWHHTGASGNRSGDPGHGVLEAPDGSRVAEGGGNSFYFGFQSRAANNTGDPAEWDPGNVNNYNFPGGAHGSLESGLFSLKGYSAADAPTLYFNYYLETEDAQHNVDTPIFMRDAFRVFVGGDDGVWHPLSTNNGAHLDDPPPPVNDEFDPSGRIQETWDNTATWRQARVSLADFAGRDNLRLRFDFSTAGSMNVGGFTQLNGRANTPTNGDELRAVDGKYLRDAQTFTLQLGTPPALRTFEFDSGFTLVAPNGAALQNGAAGQFSVNGINFEFNDGSVAVTPGYLPVSYLPSDSPAAVALSIRNAIAGSAYGAARLQLNGNRVNLRGVVGGVVTGATAANASGLLSGLGFIEGAPGVAGGSIIVPVHEGMTRLQVRDAIRQVLADTYAGGDIDQVKVHAEIIRLIGYRFNAQAAGPNADPNLDNQRLLGITRTLPGDRFGAFNAGKNLDGSTDNEDPGALRGQNNNFEGVYIDDIIIGFSERGEMVTGARDSQTNFRDAGAADEEILEGRYDLEIRRSAQYGSSDDPPLPTLLLNNPFAFGRSFDTNDRLNQSHTISAPNGADIADGSTFVLYDGVDRLTFEFDDALLNNGIVQGNVRVPYLPNMSPHHVAAVIRDVINDRTTVGQAPFQFANNPVYGVQNVLEVIAVSADGTDGETLFSSTDRRVNLIGNVRSVEIATILGGVDEAAGESNDTLTTAVATNIPPGRSIQFETQGVIGNNPLVVDGRQDVDMFRMNLNGGQTAVISIAAQSIGSGLDSILRVFDAAGVQLAVNDDFNGLDSQVTFTAPSTGVYYVGVSSYFNFSYDPTTVNSGGGFGGSSGVYELTISTGSPGGILAFDDYGDGNQFRDQGQLIIHSNLISDSSQFGIISQPGGRDGGPTVPAADSPLPHPGSVRNMREPNQNNITTGVVISNNVIARSGQGGISISSDSGGGIIAPSAYARAVNNTIYGGGAGVGIRVQGGAAPTLLNNIVSSLATGVSVANSPQTVLGGMLFHNNGQNTQGVGVGDFPIVLAASDPLFVNAAAGNFYLAQGSAAIDSAIASLPDRPEIVTVKDPLGIEVSPIIVPERDAIGQLRVDDQNTPNSGVGGNPFLDRGAIDRADFAGPIARLITPQDNDALGQDQEPAETVVRLPANAVLTRFEIQLIDGVEPFDPAGGTGPDDASVISSNVVVQRGGQILVDGVDYRFSYNANDNIIILTPLAGIWLPGPYLVTLNRTPGVGIRDVAGNMLQPNQISGETRFTIILGEPLDFGDAPASYGTLTADNGPTHVVDFGVRLGAAIDPDAEGAPTPQANGDGLDDDGVTFLGFTLQNGLPAIVPGRPMELIVNASTPGFLDAWIDFNRNGRFDQTEKIFDNLPVVGGDNSFTVSGGNAVNVPLSAVSGDSYARFRFHTVSGALMPTGPATNGEVEDYILNITPKAPWQNQRSRLDVNDDGFVTTQDALILISYLRNNGGGGALPVPPSSTNFPPPYLDVNGDNNATNADALEVIAYLRSTGGGGPAPKQSGGEGEPLVPSLAPDSGARVASSGVASGSPSAADDSASEEEPVQSGDASPTTSSAPASPQSWRRPVDKDRFDDYSQGLEIDDAFAADVASGWLAEEEPVVRRRRK